MGAPSPFWPMAAGFVFLLIGAAIAAWPRPLIRAHVRLVKPMRGLFGSVVDWEIGTLERQAAPWVVRGFGVFVMLVRASVLFFQAMRTGR